MAHFKPIEPKREPTPRKAGIVPALKLSGYEFDTGYPRPDYLGLVFLIYECSAV